MIRKYCLAKCHQNLQHQSLNDAGNLRRVRRVVFQFHSHQFLSVERTPCDCAQIASWTKRHWNSTTETYCNRELLSIGTKSSWSLIWTTIIDVAVAQWIRSPTPMESIQVEVTKLTKVRVQNIAMEYYDVAASSRTIEDWWYVGWWRHLNIIKSLLGLSPTRWKVPHVSQVVCCRMFKFVSPAVLCNQLKKSTAEVPKRTNSSFGFA